MIRKIKANDGNERGFKVHAHFFISGYLGAELHFCYVDICEIARFL